MLIMNTNELNRKTFTFSQTKLNPGHERNSSLEVNSLSYTINLLNQFNLRNSVQSQGSERLLLYRVQT